MIAEVTYGDLKRSIASVTRHGLFWLLVTNVTGVLLAVLLLVPSLGVALQPFSYGRWVTVHLNASLYGWSSVPLLGLLFIQYFPANRPGRLGEIAVGVWSGVLLFAMIGWLTGHTSGKLFMEWTGPSRWGIMAGMCFLAVSLWVAFRWRIREKSVENSDEITGRLLIAIKFLFLLLLSVIPFVMFVSADPSIYPPINPDSGGATGGSLLGSTLGIVVIYWLAPFVLNLERKAGLTRYMPILLLLILHLIAFLLLDHGDRSHHDTTQIIALSSLFIWVPLMFLHMRLFNWPRCSRIWLIAFACWGGILTLNGLITFMPSVLDAWKFTNALVAHVHIAMAGMVTNFNMLVLSVINHQYSGSGIFSSRKLFWSWQSGTALHATFLIMAGFLESMHPDWLFTGHPAINVLYLGRLVAGLMMLAPVWSWFLRAHAMKEMPI